MSIDHIFVYGSLRREFRSPARKVLDDYTEFVGKATFQGRLYMIDWYPGVVESDDPKDIVHGEVYKISDERIVLSKLDQYEGCSPCNPKPHEFVRKKKFVHLKNEEKILAWVYIYVMQVSGKKEIHSGDFVSYDS